MKILHDAIEFIFMRVIVYKSVVNFGVRIAFLKIDKNGLITALGL